MTGTGGGAAGGDAGGASGGAGGGSGGDPGCPGFAGCTSFVEPASADVTFPNGNMTYSPKCMRVHFGQRVTFTGSFSNHPLTQACGPAAVLAPGLGQTAQFMFTATGTYGYYCAMHGAPSGAGMSGAIEVVP